MLSDILLRTRWKEETPMSVCPRYRSFSFILKRRKTPIWRGGRFFVLQLVAAHNQKLFHLLFWFFGDCVIVLFSPVFPIGSYIFPWYKFYSSFHWLSLTYFGKSYFLRSLIVAILLWNYKDRFYRHLNHPPFCQFLLNILHFVIFS